MVSDMPKTMELASDRGRTWTQAGRWLEGIEITGRPAQAVLSWVLPCEHTCLEWGVLWQWRWEGISAISYRLGGRDPMNANLFSLGFQHQSNCYNQSGERNTSPNHLRRLPCWKAWGCPVHKREKGHRAVSAILCAGGWKRPWILICRQTKNSHTVEGKFERYCLELRPGRRFHHDERSRRTCEGVRLWDWDWAVYWFIYR